MRNGHLLGFMKDSGTVLPTPILEYTFASQDFTDISGFGHTGYGVGTPTFVVGKDGLGYAVNLNGTSQYFGMPSDPQWDELNGKDFSLGIWTKIPTKNWTANTTQIIGTLTMATTVPPDYWSIVTGNSVTLLEVLVDNALGVNLRSSPSSGDIVSANWKFLVMTKVGKTYSYYLDDVFQGSITFTTDGNVDNIYSVIVGGFYGRYIAMQCDSVRFYDFGLSAAEQTALYNNT